NIDLFGAALVHQGQPDTARSPRLAAGNPVGLRSRKHPDSVTDALCAHVAELVVASASRWIVGTQHDRRIDIPDVDILEHAVKRLRQVQRDAASGAVALYSQFADFRV